MALAAEDIAELASEFEELTVAGLADAAALARVGESAETSAASLARMGAPLRDTESQFKAASGAADGFKPAVLNAGQSASGAAKAFDHLKGKAGELVEGLVPTTGATGALAGALEALGPQGKAVAVVLSVLATIVIGLASKLWELTKAAVAISQEQDALEATFGALSGLDGKALDGLVDSVSELAASLPFAEGRVQVWAKSLLAAGKQGDALEQSIRAVAAATALMGDQGGAAAETLIKRFAMMAATGQKVKLDRRIMTALAEAGVSAQTLAAELGVPVEQLGKMQLEAGKLGESFEKALMKKGVGALATMSLTWKSITGKLGDAWDDLFEKLGPAVQPLMTAIRDFFSEFSAGTTLQSGAKSVFVSFFTTILGWATRAMRAIHIGFLELQIAALKAYVWAAPLVRLMRDIWTNAVVLRGIKTILMLLAAPFVLLAGAVVLVVTALVALGTAATIAWSFVAAGAAYAMGIIRDAPKILSDFGARAGEIGRDFIAGLVRGIASGVGAVVDAVKGVAKSAEEAFTSFFGIRSPSTKMKGHGRQLPAGGAEGVEENAVVLEKAMDGMWQVPSPKGKGQRGGGGGRGKLADTISIVFQGRASEFDEFREKAEQWLEQLAAGGPEPETT